MKVIIELYNGTVRLENCRNNEDHFLLWTDFNRDKENCIKLSISDMQEALRKMVTK